MKITNIVYLQKILIEAMPLCSGSEFKSFTSWLTDSANYNATASQIAERTNSKRQNASRDMNNLIKNRILDLGPKQKVPGSKQWKNTYTLGPIFNDILGITHKPKPTTADFSNYVPKPSLATFELVKRLVSSLNEVVQTHKLKINRGDGKLLNSMDNKVHALETRIKEGNYEHIDYKIQDIVDFAQSNRAWINNRTENLYFNKQVSERIQLPAFNDLNLPTLKDMKNEKTA